LQEQLGIGLSQYRILMVLELSPDLQQRAIATALGQTEASISRQIKVLQAKGLLMSNSLKGDKRVHRTTPTTLGIQLTEAANQIIASNFKTDFDELGDNYQKQLFEELENLHKAVCRPGRVGACDHLLGL
jgi:DNA-binding MarR family transcriptional regulator